MARSTGKPPVHHPPPQALHLHRGKWLCPGKAWRIQSWARSPPECEWVTGDSSGREPGHPFLRLCRQPPPMQAERATPPSLRSREPPHNGSLSLMTPNLFTLERNSSDMLSHKGPEVHKTDQSGPGDQGHTEPGWVLGARLQPTSLGEWPSLSEPQLPCLRNGLTSPSCCPGPHSRPLSCHLSGLTVLGPADTGSSSVKWRASDTSHLPVILCHSDPGWRVLSV